MSATQKSFPNVAILTALLLMNLPAVAPAEDYTYTTNNGTITITGYTGPGGAVTIPSMITGLSVTSVGDYAFQNNVTLTSITIPSSVSTIGSLAFSGCSSLTNATIPNGVTDIWFEAFRECTSLTEATLPNSLTNLGYQVFWGCTSLASVTIGTGVTEIGSGAFGDCTSLTRITIPNNVTFIGGYGFAGCTNLTGVNFQGNAPYLEMVTRAGVGTYIQTPVFDGVNATAYYLPSSTGWASTFGDLPTALWKPQVQTSDASFGVQTNQFGFNIAWASGQVVVVEAATNLANPTWLPLQTNTLTADTLYFSDPQWVNYPGRFYRIRSP